ncbi:MAG TPA: long-chain-fatty-acid--CoA ligase [Rhizomicrobium sp.]|nr:long-chain-fatty-acid--CoA ligase [Rhizomicrobium sp.]
MRGLMQDWPLRVHRFLDHAALYHQDARIVSRTVEGDIHRTSYPEIRRRARALSGALQRRGVKRGDRVATLAWNTHRHMEAWYGIAGAGAVYHTLNPRLFPEQIAWIANHGGARLLMFDICFAPILESIASRLKHIATYVAMTDKAHLPKLKLSGKLIAYEELIAGKETDWAEVDENDACGLCYTSGTTGDPKGVLYSHRSNVLHSLLTGQSPGLGLGAGDVMLPIVPLFHANGWGIPFTAPMAGASLVMPGQKLDGASLYELLESEKVTCSAGVPTVWLGLLQYLEANRLTLHHLKRMVIGGAACPRAVIEAFGARGITVNHAWGMTEMSPSGTMSAIKPPLDSWPHEAQVEALCKQGYPLFGVEMKITDDKGKEKPRDGKGVGRLKVKGPAIAKGYFRGAGKEGFDRDNWFDTGDVASIDPHGFMHITDRSKDVIKSGGEWISSIEIENLAVGHPHVAEAAVIGVPHPKWSERPLLIVVAKPGQKPSADALLNHLRGKIARWWLPDAVVLVDEIPHTATGKILKTELRRRFADFRLDA